MNYGISVIFRAIPLLMALFCFSYGLFIFDSGTETDRFVAGPVVFSLGMICIALFATAATIIRQIIHTYNSVVKYALPIVGYLSAVITVIGGLFLLTLPSDSSLFVVGHVICGVGFITACVATTATSSTRFTLIQINAKSEDPRIPKEAFTKGQAVTLISISVIIAVITWVWAFKLLSQSGEHSQYFIAGHVMAGLACICTSLVALVATIVRQIRNTYSDFERNWWPGFVLFFGTLSIFWGLIIMGIENPLKSTTGYIMVGLGLVCYSISSKVILLAKIWKREFKLANRIPLIPIFTALACFFMSSYLFDIAEESVFYFVPARVLAGLGGICFTLFSIVSILESGTSTK
ncbi:DUF2776 family protein [Parabacteroides bouchesdurhonensis]|uniref:DUF2776 family protein n=1 Tax=Parabacteroides bouchesdurhonensis TaxID=1936995 RepID=UPI000E4F9D2C|nr:DUF2776 family protein [Parabacteroides bouchesdurhonensis]RHJ95335.1 DUF2776 family protein [Bacteroides sp. AM07-16]